MKQVGIMKLTSFAWCSMGAVLRAVPGDNLVSSVIPSNGEGNFNYVITLLHSQQNTFHFKSLLFLGHLRLHLFDEFVFGDLASAMEEVLDHVEKPRVFGGGYIFQFVWDLVEGPLSPENGRAQSFQEVHVSSFTGDGFTNGFEMEHCNHG